MGGLRSENRRIDCSFSEARFKEPRGAATFLTVARARERIAMYINGYSNITHRAQKEQQGRLEQTPRVNSNLNIRLYLISSSYR